MTGGQTEQEGSRRAGPRGAQLRPGGDDGGKEFDKRGKRRRRAGWNKDTSLLLLLLLQRLGSAGGFLHIVHSLKYTSISECH